MKSWTDEAIVLRTHNVGETDRFCIVLSKSRGRVAVRAVGARRLLSRRANGLLPLHRVMMTCEMHSFGVTVTSVSCLDPHRLSWCDPHAFSCTEQGIELLLRLTEDAQHIEGLYELTCEFVAACATLSPAQVPPLFALKLLDLLGLFPSVTHSSLSHHPFASGDRVRFSQRLGGLVSQQEDPAGFSISSELLALLQRLPSSSLHDVPRCSTELLSELVHFVHCLLGNQLGAGLKAPDIAFALSAAVTPI